MLATRWRALLIGFPVIGVADLKKLDIENQHTAGTVAAWDYWSEC